MWTTVSTGKEGGGETGLRAGDGVRVELDPHQFKTAQESSHGGWENYMAEVT